MSRGTSRYRNIWETLDIFVYLQQAAQSDDEARASLGVRAAMCCWDWRAHKGYPPRTSLSHNWQTLHCPAKLIDVNGFQRTCSLRGQGVGQIHPPPTKLRLVEKKPMSNRIGGNRGQLNFHRLVNDSNCDWQCDPRLEIDCGSEWTNRVINWNCPVTLYRPLLQPPLNRNTSVRSAERDVIGPNCCGHNLFFG